MRIYPFRFAPRHAWRRRYNLKARCGYIFIAIAILIVTIGTLCTESRLVGPHPNSSTWHTSKTGRMTEIGVQKLDPERRQIVESIVPIFTPTAHFPVVLAEVPLPELVGALDSHTLRAPPRA